MKRGPRKRGEPELWGATEAARCLGVEQTNLRSVGGFDQIEPYQDGLIRGFLYRADEVRELAEKRRQPKESAPAPEVVAA